MISNFGFVSPLYVLLVLGLIPLWTFLTLAERRIQGRCRALGVATRVQLASRERIALIAALLLSLSLARPYWGYHEVKVPSSARDLMVVFDVSESMRTDDIQPSRLLAARRKLEDLLSLLKDQHRGDRIGIVLFSGGSYLYCPLTSDYAVVRRFAHSATPELITRGGSTLGDAVKTAAEALTRAEAKHGSILIISDGEDSSLNDAIVSELVALRFPVSAIGVGTTEGKPIRLVSGSFVKDNKGEIVVSKLAEENMKRLSHESGGVYSRISLNDSDIQQVLDSTKDLYDHREDAGALRVYNELGPVLCLCALILLGASPLMPRYRTLFGVAIALISLLRPPTACADDTSIPTSLRDAGQLYELGDYESAEAAFENSLSEDPSRSTVASALGNTQYRLGKFEEAALSFEKAYKSATSDPERFRALYNGGTSHYMSGKFDKAVSMLEEARKLRPTDSPTRFNYELAKKRLQEQQQEQKKEKKEETKDEKDTSDKKKNESKDSQEDNSKESKDSKEKGSTGDSNTPENKSGEGTKEEKDNKTAQDQKDQESSPDTSDSKNSDTPNGEENRESDNGETSQEDQSSVEEKKGDLKEEEARAWLDSLSDAPILLRRQNPPQNSTTGQTW